MVTNKRLGLTIIILAPIALALFVIGIAFLGYILFEGIVFLVVAASISLMGWIGYTLFTEPPSPRADISDLDSLEPETIRAGDGNLAANSRLSVIRDCEIGEGTIIRDQVNLYKCHIGRDCKIESFVYIEEGVRIGDRCKIKPNVFIPSGVVIEDDVFVGPNATFTNDKHPQVAGEWEMLNTVICTGAAIGAHAVILPGIRVGRNAIVGAGAVVTKDVEDGMVVTGNPARTLRKIVAQID